PMRTNLTSPVRPGLITVRSDAAGPRQLPPADASRTADVRRLPQDLHQPVDVRDRDDIRTPGTDGEPDGRPRVEQETDELLASRPITPPGEVLPRIDRGRLDGDHVRAGDRLAEHRPHREPQRHVVHRD